MNQDWFMEGARERAAVSNLWMFAWHLESRKFGCRILLNQRSQKSRNQPDFHKISNCKANIGSLSPDWTRPKANCIKDDGKQQHPERITKNTRDRLAQELLDNGNISEAKINMLTHMSGTDPSDILEASPDVDFDFNDAEQPLPPKVKNNRSKSEPLPVSGSPEERAKTQRIIERNNQGSFSPY